MPEQSAEELQKNEISKEGRKNLREDAVRATLFRAATVKLADASFESVTREDACGIRCV
jgi:hypothetical protein